VHGNWEKVPFQFKFDHRDVLAVSKIDNDDESFFVLTKDWDHETGIYYLDPKKPFVHIPRPENLTKKADDVKIELVTAVTLDIKENFEKEVVVVATVSKEDKVVMK
jgi:hypothetical protein